MYTYIFTQAIRFLTMLSCADAAEADILYSQRREHSQEIESCFQRFGFCFCSCFESLCLRPSLDLQICKHCGWDNERFAVLPILCFAESSRNKYDDCFITDKINSPDSFGFQEDLMLLVCALSDQQLGVCRHLTGRFCTLLYAQHIFPFN